MNLRKWLNDHSLKLLAIRDTPEAIAGAIAIGMFFGFTPLFGLKTLLSILFAWIFRCNLLAAALAVTLHDLALPFMPFVLRLEYDIGYWLMSNPHRLPSPMRHMHWNLHAWRSWTTFVTVGAPMLLGSVICATPVAVLSYFVSRPAIRRWQKKHGHSAPPPEASDGQGSG
jgi:uncharacterized protein